MHGHHKLAPSLYECFYNTLTICSTFNVDTIIDMMLRWHCNNMSWNGIDIILKHLTSYQYYINEKNMTNIGTTYINKSSNWWLYVEDSMLIWSLIQYVDGTITICIELALGLFWHNLHFFNTHSKNKILSMLRQHKLISYWIDVVTTFIKVEFQCCCISYKINTLKMLKQWYSLSQH